MCLDNRISFIRLMRSNIFPFPWKLEDAPALLLLLLLLASIRMRCSPLLLFFFLLWSVGLARVCCGT